VPGRGGIIHIALDDSSSVSVEVLSVTTDVCDIEAELSILNLENVLVKLLFTLVIYVSLT